MAKGGTSKRAEGKPLPSETADDKYDAMDAWQTSVESRLASIDARLGSLDGKADQHFTSLLDRMDQQYHGLMNRMDQQFNILLTRMDRQFYVLLIGGVIGFVGMAGLMARGFGWL